MKKSNIVKSGRYLHKGFRFLGLLIVIILLSWVLKSTVFSLFYIPSHSMYPALKMGEYVLVSKFHYNLRTPEYYPLTAIAFPYFFADGFGKIKRGDVIVFDLPLFSPQIHPSERKNYIKRCVGLPGDTVLIHESRYYLQRNTHSEKYKRYINRLLKDSIATTFIIPQKGSWIQLADSTQDIWKPILLRDGNNVTQDTLDNVLVNGMQKTKYQVLNDYYFVKGDNNRFSSDSRSWGLVPKSYLIGRAEVVIWPWPPKLL